MTNELVFRESDHSYWRAGKRVVNVTRVLDYFYHTYDRVPRETLERARQEGLAIHRTIELYLKNNLGECPEWLKPYVEAFEAFRRDTRFRLESSEQRHYHPLHDYAGTSDLIGYMELRRLGECHVLIDIKRSFLAGDSIALQTAGYAAAYNDDRAHQRIHHRFALRFKPGKKPPYEMIDFINKKDREDWLAMLQTYKRLEEHGNLDNAAR